MNKLLHVGLDIGSTTVKIVILNEDLETIYSNYERHFSDTKSTLYNVLNKLILYSLRIKIIPWKINIFYFFNLYDFLT